MKPLTIFIGYDRREQRAYDVCAASLRKNSPANLNIRPLVMADLRAAGVYMRPTETRDNKLWDVISSVPMSTQFALTRFLVPQIMRQTGVDDWALFVDCDFMFRADVAQLFALAEPKYAVMVVKHYMAPRPGEKMDAQAQKWHTRKNWSSLMLWNCSHIANRRLDVAAINNRDYFWFHNFGWLHDSDIGNLHEEWNTLNVAPLAMHFTLGCPDMHGYEDQPFAAEWLSYKVPSQESSVESALSPYQDCNLRG